MGKGGVKALLGLFGREGLGPRRPACYGRKKPSGEKGMPVAEEEPILTNPPTQEMAVHVRDYDRFTKMMFRGAIICGIIGFIVLMILY
jgi:hypothetical protein